MDNLLILLIGGNPLPNYVVLDYLLKSERSDKEEMPIPNIVALLHSEETENFAFKIKEKFENNVKFELINLEKEERSGKKIKQELNNFFDSNSDFNSIHLNYTGGTKPMAVHSYITVYEYKPKTLKIFSDLDPVKSKIQLDNGYYYPTSSDLKKEVNISIKELINLHCLEVQNKGDKETTYKQEIIDINEFAKDALSKMKPKEERLGWVKKLKSYFTSKKENKLKKDLPSYDFGPFEDYKSLPEEYPSLKKLFKDNKFNFEAQENIPLTKFFEFFDGKWLEDYIYEVLEELIEKKEIWDITDLRKNFEFKSNKRGAEIDIIAVKGFKAFYITCTTSCKIGIIKQKAFEALYRAEQISGQHAAVIVVSPMPSTGEGSSQENLKKDLSEFRASKKCSLIGYEDLCDIEILKRKLIKIIKEEEVS